MSEASRLERYLARLYAEPDELAHFLARPDEAMAAAALATDDAAALRAIDRVGLVMAARSYQRKRAGREAGSGRTGDPKR